MSKPVTVFVHAGLPKTGTTTIQATLFKNKDRLAEAGIFLPVFASKMPGHRKLSTLWRDVDRSRKPISPADLLAGLRASIDQARLSGGAVILSSETLSDPDARSGAEVLPQLIREAGGELRVLAYARSPIDHLPSSVQQESKAYQPEYSPIAKRILIHTRRYENLKTLFGRDAITLRIFDRGVLAGGDVVTDFAEACARLGLAVPDLDPAEVENESIGAPACALLLTLRDALEGRLLDRPSEAFVNVRRALIRFENKVGRGPKLKIPTEWLPTLEDIARDPWNRLLEDAVVNDADRSRLRIVERNAPVEPVRMDRSAWLLSYRDRDYEKRFVDFYKHQPRVKLPNLGKLLAKP